MGKWFQLFKLPVKKLSVKRLKNIHHIALTTDTWKSFAKQSYITLTCHIIDHNGQLHNILLITAEIKTRHTSENLRKHIETELVKWVLESSDSVVTNFNSTNNNDIAAETEDIGEEDGDVFCKKLVIILKKMMIHLTGI